MLTKSDLMYDLPEELIAQHPPKVRGTCRLMVLNRRDRSFHEEKFSRIREYIKPEDALVLNDTRVIRARLSGKREDTGGTVEFLLLQELSPLVWKTMVRPGRQCRTGNVFQFNHSLQATVVKELGKGRAVVEFSSGGNTSELIEKSGTVPIPPYIKRLPDELDSVRYQTVFAENDGAVAAPTAGLHFTPGILQSIEDTGTSINRLTLHVGPGTFQPLRRELLAENTMEEERYSISAETLESLRRCRQKGGRIVAAGTTVTRTLESIDINSRNSLSGSTSIFIHTPPTGSGMLMFFSLISISLEAL